MASVYTVGQINSYIKNMLNQDFALKNIYIKGEVSNCKYHSSGHIFFTLKDDAGIISAIMYAGKRRTGLKFKMEEGQDVIVLGSIGVYETDGKYQLYADKIILDGVGVLYQRFEQLKTELSEMGLFAEMYKKRIPKYSMKIGICTAPTGAAIRDIINISTRRNPYVQLYLYPALVQGKDAPGDIVRGIRYLDGMGLDVIIVGRGGGSIEDLWAFNERAVAQAIFDCNTPIISAVGHETDTTIADYVADQRAPTPSAAAELAVFDYKIFLSQLDYYTQMFRSVMREMTGRYSDKTKKYEAKIQLYSPVNRLNMQKKHLNELSLKLTESFMRVFNDRKYQTAIYSEKLSGLSPLKRISKGFAYVSDLSGQPVLKAAQMTKGDDIKLTMSDGSVEAVVTKTDGGRQNGE